MKQENLRKDIKALRIIILPAIIIVFGLQALRGLIPGLAWYLRDTVGLSTISIIPYAFGTFFLGFIAILLSRVLGTRLSLWISAGGLTLLRLIEMAVKDPPLDFWLGIASVGLFLTSMPLLIAWSSDQTEQNPEPFYQGLVIGFGLDIFLRGIFGMRGLSTLGSWTPVGVTALLGALVIWGLRQEHTSETSRFGEGHGKSVTLLLALGPYFLLQLFYFQNTGWLEEVANLHYPAGFLVIGLGYVISAGGLALGYARPKSLHPSLALGSSLLLIYCVYYGDQLGRGAVGLILAGQFVLGWGLAGIGRANQDIRHKSLWRTTLAVTGGMLLFLILSFTFYAAQDIALPFPRASLPALAAGAFGLLSIWASFQVWKGPGATLDLAGLIVTCLLLVGPIVSWLSWEGGPTGKEPSGFPVKVMSYNIHSAFNVEGGQDLEAIAAVIEDSEADIIGLQEVSRTRLMDGGSDMPIWLAQRLGMEMIFEGTEEPIWGNALLSRYPIVESGYQSLPREGSLIGRGFIWARIDIGAQEPLLVVVTHLHHITADSEIRLAQVPVILDFLEGKDQFVFLGDLNADPDSPEIKLIREAGLIDSWQEAGEGPGFTINSFSPVARIDYLWHSPDLAVSEMEVIQTTASDHLPVIAVVER